MEEFLPYGKQFINEEDIEGVVKTLRSSFLTQGPQVPRFEEGVALETQAKHAVAVNSATSALHIACLAVGVGRGDVVWTSPITFVASANCALYCGAAVDFVDVDPKSGLIDVNVLETKLIKAEKLGQLPKVIIPVHLAGTSCKMDRIAELARSYGVRVIEDASHAIGGKYKGNKVGSCSYSDITVFSFHPVKIITTGEGGLATTNSDELAEKMRLYRSHGIQKDPCRFENQDQRPWIYEQQGLGYNYRMNDISASLGISQISRLTTIVGERNRLLEVYKKETEDLPIEFLEVETGVVSAVHLAVALVPTCQESDIQLSLYEHLRERGIGTQVHYIPVHLQPFYKKRGFKHGDFPAAEYYYSRALSLPMFYGLDGHSNLYAAP